MEDRPKITVILKPADQLVEVLGWLTLLFLWVITLYNYSSLPQIIPIHFNAAGHADGFGSKLTLFLLPVIGTVLFVAITALNKYPHIFNYPSAITPENALTQYTNATRMMRYIKINYPGYFYSNRLDYNRCCYRKINQTFSMVFVCNNWIDFYYNLSFSVQIC